MDFSLQFGEIYWCTLCAKPRKTPTKASNCCFWQQKKSAQRMLSEKAFLAKYRPSCVVPTQEPVVMPPLKKMASPSMKTLGSKNRASAPRRYNVAEAVAASRLYRQQQRREREARQAARRAEKLRRQQRRAAFAARAANRMYGAHLPRNPYEVRGRAIVRKFADSCRGVANLRQILFDAYVCGNFSTKYILALKINAAIIGARSDYIVEYLIDTHLGLDPERTTQIDSWLRASPATRRSMYLHQLIVRHSDAKPKKIRYTIDWAAIKRQKRQRVAVDAMIDEEVDQMFTPRPQRTKRGIFQEDANNLRPIGAEQTCETFATFCGVFRNFRERLAWSYVNLKDDADKCIKYFDSLSRVVKIVVPRFAVPQADSEAAHGGGEVSLSASQNVIITTAREVSADGIPRIGTWINSTTEDTVGSFPELLERWNPIAQFQWKTSQAADAGILEMALPREAVSNSNNKGLISYIPFFNHQYWRGDMEIRIEANVNKFMIGQLQAAFYYGWDYDINRNLRKNVSCLSQCQHVIIDAGGSNSGSLIIPFKNQSACVSTREVNGVGALYVGTLHVRVLSALLVPEGSPNECSVVVYMRFLNSQFTGQISRNISAIPQMEAAACYLLQRGAERLLDTVAADPNRDNPTAIVPPTYIVPTASHSWSVGTGVAEPLHMLRLDATGQTHHPTGIALDEHSSVLDVARIFGLVGRFPWKTSMAAGARVYTTVVNPTSVHVEHNSTTLNTVILTPVQVMSNLFAQWRGSIEYRFDIVASQFHTGRLMVAFIPNATTIDDSKITFDVAKSSYNVVIDLHEQRSFTFVAPYVNTDPWNRRRYTMDGTDLDLSQHGKLVVYALCALNCPDTVSKDIEILVYMRAGPSFELAIPVQPTVGLGCNSKTVSYDWNELTPVDGQSPVYLGTWDNYWGNNELVARWGVLAGRVCEFPRAIHWNDPRHARTKMYWQCNEAMPVTTTDGKAIAVKHFCVTKQDDIYAAWPCASALDAVKMWIDYMAGRESWKSYIVKGTATVWYSNFSLTRQIYYANSQGERDNVEIKLDPSTSLLSTGAGRQLYGESFIRLKDIMRRYQFYGSIIVEKQRMQQAMAMFKFPVVPGGLNLDIGTAISPNNVANKCREGIIPIVLSGYRYYRGSIRFRIVFPCGFNGSLWVQHRPDCWNGDFMVADATDKDDELTMLAHGYAMYIQHAVVNGILEFEVPYYQTGVYGIIGDTDVAGAKPYTNNGTIVVGNTSGTITSACRFDVFYSLGDDFNYNTFQGFMPMVDAASIALANVSRQPILKRERTTSWELCGATSCMTMAPRAEPQMFSWAKSKVREAVIDEVREATQDVVDEVKERAAQAAEQLGSVPDVVDRGLLADFVFCLTHIADNPTIRTIALSIVHFLSKLGLKLSEYVQTAYKFVALLFNLNGLTSTKQNSEDGSNMEMTPRIAVSQSDEERDCIIFEWISALVTAVSMAMGFAVKKPLDPAIKMKFILDMTGKSINTGNALLRFLKGHVNLISAISDWILYQVCPEMRHARLFEKEDMRVKMWIEDAIALLNIDVRRPDLVSDAFMDRLTASELIGREILATFSCIERRSKEVLSGYIEKYYDKINALLRAQISKGKYPYLRIKPLHIQLFGAAGIGKTSLLRGLSKYIMNMIGERITSPNYICFVDSSDKFWSQCDGSQPVVVIDDLWAVTTPNILESQLTTYFSLYGDTVFTPPMAAVEDKKIRYAPKLMLTTTNKPQEKFANVDREAFQRRRDFLIEVVKAELDPVGHPECAHCRGESLSSTNPDELADFHHIAFYRQNIFGKSGCPEDRTSGLMTWKQFQSFLLQNALPIYRNSQANYEREVETFAFSDEVLDDEMELDLRVKIRYDGLRAAHAQRYTRVAEMLPMAAKYFKEKCSFEKFAMSQYWKKFLPMSAVPQSNPFDSSLEAKAAAAYFRVSQDAMDAIWEGEKARALMVKFHASSPDWKQAHIKLWAGDFPEYSSCVHLKREYLESYCVDDMFMLNGDTKSTQHRCDDGCVLDDEGLRRLWGLSWLHTGATKLRHFRSGNVKRIPSFLLNEELLPNEAGAIMTSLRKAFDVMVKGWQALASGFWKAWGVIQRAVKWLRDLASKYWYIVLPLVACIGATLIPVAAAKIGTAIGSMAYAADRCFGGTYTKEDIEKFESQGKIYAQSNPRVARVRVAKPVAAPEAGVSQQGECAEALVRLNAAYVTIEYVDDTGFMRSNKFMGLFLYERKILLQRHYIETIMAAPKSATVRLRYVEKTERMIHGDKGMPIDILNCHMEYYHYEDGKRDSNFVLVTMPKHINCHKNLVKFMAPAATHAYIGRYVNFVRPGSSTHRVEMNIGAGVVIAGVENNRFSADIEMDRTYEYKMSCPGYCGSIILDPALQHPIIGMHVAGMTGREVGIAEIITREAFQTSPCEKSPIVDIADMELSDTEFAKINLSTQLYVRGTVDSKHSVSQSSETAYEKSIAVNKILPILGEPMPLGKNDPRMGGEDPLALGCDCHGLLSKEFPKKLIDAAEEHYRAKVLINCKPVRQSVGVMSYQDVIVGVPEIPEFAPLEWGTSEGFPLQKLRPTGVRGKKWLFDLVEKNDGSLELAGMHPELKRLLAEQEACRKRGVKPTTVYVDCLKDEIREFAKARTPGKTRVISTCPVQYLIAFKRYFGDFMAAFKRARFDVESGIGMNPDSSEWSILARKLQEVGPKIIAGDYSKFGYTLNSEVLSRTFRIMNAWYAKYSDSPTLETDQLVRAVIAEEGINVTRLARNLIYDAPCGIASGFPTTDISNTMVNNLYVRMSWIATTGTNMREFERHVRLVTYGDDLIANVSDEMVKVFNAETMQHFFAKYDIKFTDIDKTGEIVLFRTLSNAPFLKREFVKHPTRSGLYLAQINEASISNCVNWVRKKDEPLPALVENCRAAMNLAYGHGPAYYNNLYCKIKTVLEEFDYQFTTDTWTELDEKNLGSN